MGRQVVNRHMLIKPEAVEQRALCHLPSHHVRDPLPSAKSESRLHRRRKHAFFNSLGRL
jgi:hypothetical protein